MPLGIKLREKQNKKDEMIFKLCKGASDQVVADALGMTRMGIWKAKRRHEQRLKEFEIKNA